MFFEQINILNSSIATLLALAFGFVWYSPYLFGGIWKKRVGAVHNVYGFYRYLPMVLTIVSVVLFTLGVSVVMQSIFLASFYSMLTAGFVLFLGFVVPTRLFQFAYSVDKDWVVLSIDLGFYLVTVLLITFISSI